MADDLSEAAIKLIRDAVRDAMRNGGPTPMAGSHRLPEDDRLRVMIEDVVDRKLAAFERTMSKTIQGLIEENCRKLGLRVDDDHIVETGNDVRGLLAMRKSFTRLVVALQITLGTGVVIGLLKLLGLNLPTGGEH